MAYPAIWLNGKFVGGWAYGYQSFRVDLTPYLECGKENVLSVRLENLPESSRWYPGAGIYRNVWLVKTAPVHIAQWGTFITTPEVTQNAAAVNIKTVIENKTPAPVTVSLENKIYKLTNGQKSKNPVSVSAPANLNLRAGLNQASEIILSVGKPELWDTKTPNLYA